MSKPKGLTVNESEISQEFDLKKLTGADLSNNPDLVEAIAQESLDYMLNRVSENKGLGGKKLKSPYSKDYSESLDFKAAGKSKNNVNMRLSGDMLETIDITTANNKFKLEVASDQVAKAYGHMSGFEGHPTIPKGKYKREFFGLTESEFKENILPKFKNEIKRAKSESGESAVRDLVQAIRTIRASTLFDDEG